MPHLRVLFSCRSKRWAAIARTSLLAAVLAVTTHRVQADPTATQTPEALAIANQRTIVRAEAKGGQATGFDLIEAGANRRIARVEIGGDGRWTAACSATAEGGTASLLFTSIDTRNTGGTPILDPASEVRVELRGDDPFPFVSFRLSATRLDPATWEKAIGGKAPLHFLACRMDSAQVFYRGGFETPLPSLDPFPFGSDSLRGEWDGGWTSAVAMGACPVPSVGLWDPAGAMFVGYEFQEARNSDKSDRRIASACRAKAGQGGPIFALLPPTEGAASRFRLIYSSSLPASGAANEFVLGHIWRAYGDRLPPVPAANDLGWMPAQDRFAPDSATMGALFRRIAKGSHDPDKILFCDNTLVSADDPDGIRNLMAGSDAARKEALLKEVSVVREKAVRETVAGEECVSWRFPFDGDYENIFGGKAAATTHSPCTWQIAASLLAVYEGNRDASLLPCIDGAFRWARHCAFTRAGDYSLPAAASISRADAGPVHFFLRFHHMFKDGNDSKRKAMAEEALALGRSALYRGLAVYIGDPDDTDNLDPTFLIQPDNDRASAGTVTWKRTGALVCAMALYAVETGDPLLAHLVRGALDRRPLGVEADGFHTIEDLDVIGIGPDTKGRRTGLLDPDEAIARWLQPVRPAKLRVLCGRKAALAFSFCAAADVENYRFEAPMTISFDVVGVSEQELDIGLTSAFRDLRGAKVLINGQAVQAEVVGRQGENAVVRGVKARQAALAAPANLPDTFGAFTLVALPLDKALDRSWGNGLSWAGLTEGVRFAWAAPFRIAPGVVAADVSTRPLSVKLRARVASAFWFASPSETAPVVAVTYADGKTERHELTRHVPALVSGPIREWAVDMYPMKLDRTDADVERMEISGRPLVFALTTCSAPSPAVETALAHYEEKRKAKEAALRAEEALRAANAHILPDLRAKVASATRGKALRIAFLPPHDGFTDGLRAACGGLGAPPALLSPEEVIDPKRFNSDLYAVAVYTAPETFVHTVKKPGDAAEAIKRYLAGGGCLVVAADGYPFYYGVGPSGDRTSLVKGLKNGQTCADLEIFIPWAELPPLTEIPKYELVAGQGIFTHLPPTFRHDNSVGGPYRPVGREGLPAEDVFRPALVLKDSSGKEHGVVVAEIEHHCPRYSGGRVVFLWGNILAMEIGPTIALDVMSHAIGTAKMKPGVIRSPGVALLPRDVAGHEKAIERACAAAGVKPQMLSVEEFTDPAVFNPRNFPVAIHAVQDEYFLDECAGRSNVWQTYVDYVKGGGLLVACGNMWQFFYAGRLDANGKWQQKHDAEQLIPDGLGLRVVNSRITDSRRMFLRCVPGQDVIQFKSPIPLEYLTQTRYRGVIADEAFDTELAPIAEVVDEAGNSFGGFAIAAVRFKKKELEGAEMLWLWGDLLDDERAYPLLDQALRYASARRRAELEAGR